MGELLYVWSHWVWPILLFLLGLGLVVFFHELGHFLMAKWVGIGVERFAIGMGPRLVGIRRGETDYCICAVPVGGYVKMVGQEDFGPLSEGQADPRAYGSKSVGARLAAISAGVVMNVVLAGLLFLVVGLAGKDFQAPYVGSAEPGLPAGEAAIRWELPAEAPSAGAPMTTPSPASGPSGLGLQPGDKVLRIEGDSLLLTLCGRGIRHFDDIHIVGILSDIDDRYAFTIERVVDGRKLIGTALIGVRKNGDVPRFGIAPAMDNVVARPKEVAVSSDFMPGDRVVAIDGLPIAHHWDIPKVEQGLTGRPVTVAVEREGRREEFSVQPSLINSDGVIYLKDGRRLRGKVVGASADEFTFARSDGGQEVVPNDDVATNILDVLGLIPRMRILAVEKGSPADKAGLAPGDAIVGYGDQGAPTHGQLLEINRRAVGTETGITVLRGRQRLDLTVAPKQRKGRAQIGVYQDGDLMHPVVAGVRPDSPAARAGIEAGAEILAVNGAQVSSWIDLFTALKAQQGKEVSISYRLGGRDGAADLGLLDRDKFDPADYRLLLFRMDVPFQPLTVRFRETNPLRAMAWGTKETVRQILVAYISLRSLIRGTVSRNTITGPVGMGALAIQYGRRDLVHFVYFMAIISAVLAVMNFLPIPVLDGGHAVLLLIEKVRGRPLPVKVMNIIQVAGLLLLLGVLVAVTWNDIARIGQNLW